MTRNEVLVALRARMDALVAAGAFTADGEAIEVRWDGDNYGPLPDEPAPHAFCMVEFDPGEQAIEFGEGIGRNRWMSTGTFAVLIYTSATRGAGMGLRVGDIASAWFRGYRVADLTCFGAAVVDAGRDRNNAGYRRTEVLVDIKFDLIG